MSLGTYLDGNDYFLDILIDNIKERSPTRPVIVILDNEQLLHEVFP
jgi:hypothetical protein